MQIKKESNKITRITTYLSIITLNVNSLSSPIKRHRLEDWIKKIKPNRLLITDMQLTGKDKHKLKIKRTRKIFLSK
jgi:exonuclease III